MERKFFSREEADAFISALLNEHDLGELKQIFPEGLVVIGPSGEDPDHGKKEGVLRHLLVIGPFRPLDDE